MPEANRRSEESIKALKEAETVFKIQIEELRKENVQLKDMITKPLQTTCQVENVRPIEDEVEKNKGKVMHKSTMHFNPAK